MNSYFEHPTGFYNPAHHPPHPAHHPVADPHQSAYRSFPHPLSDVPVPPQASYQPETQTNSSSTASDYSAPHPPSQPPVSSVFKNECGIYTSKEQNGFKPPDQMSAWNSAASLRPPPTTGAGFDGRSVGDGWSGCCQNTAPGFVDPYSSQRSFDGHDYHHHHRYAGNGSTESAASPPPPVPGVPSPGSQANSGSDNLSKLYPWMRSQFGQYHFSALIICLFSQPLLCYVILACAFLPNLNFWSACPPLSCPLPLTRVAS